MRVFGVFDADGRLFAVFSDEEDALSHVAHMDDHDDYAATEFFVQPLTMNRPNERPIWDMSPEES